MESQFDKIQVLKTFDSEQDAMEYIDWMTDSEYRRRLGMMPTLEFNRIYPDRVRTVNRYVVFEEK